MAPALRGVAQLLIGNTAFALPMLLDRRVDGVTAVVTSIDAVLRNKAAMLVWSLLIVVAIATGFATALVGLIVTMPAIGHAAWHAYRETIDPATWPAYPRRALPVASRWRAAASSTRE